MARVGRAEYPATVVNLTPENLDELRNASKQAQEAVPELQIDDVAVSAGEDHDDIQDIHLAVTLKVSEDDGWEPEAGAKLRDRIREAATGYLRSTYPNELFVVIPQLRPLNASEEPDA